MILITTPTGDIGSQVLNILLESAPSKAEELRVIVRDPTKLSPTVLDRVDVVTSWHADAHVVDRAFAGTDAVFWLVPPDAQAPSLDVAYSGFTQAAAQAFVTHGVRHVVGISALGRGTPVAGTEAADRKAPTAATRDIAAKAVALLLDRSWSGVGSVAVLGPEDLSPNDMARIMSEELGQPVRYERRSLDDFGKTLAGYGMDEAFVQGMVDMMRAKDDRLDDGVQRTSDTTSLTTFRQWCEEVLKPVPA